MWPRIPLPLVVTLLFLLACGRSSPTEPPLPADLTGVWEGAVAGNPSGEDWSRVRLSLQTLGGTISGTLVSRDGIAHPVSSRTVEGVVVLDVGELPRNPPCNITLVVARVSATAMEGSVSGRCPNTLLSTFRLEKSR